MYIIYGLIYIVRSELNWTAKTAAATAYIRHIDADTDLQKCVYSRRVIFHCFFFFFSIFTLLCFELIWKSIYIFCGLYWIKWNRIKSDSVGLQKKAINERDTAPMHSRGHDVRTFSSHQFSVDIDNDDDDVQSGDFDCVDWISVCVF